MNTLIGERIKVLRKNKGLSQEQVAEHLHISQSAYARMEKGESQSWVNYLDAISKLFEIQPEELIKQESVIINSNQKGGESNNAIIINQLSEKLIEQYEIRLKEKDNIIASLRAQLNEKL